MKNVIKKSLKSVMKTAFENQSVVKIDNHFFIMWYEYTYNIDATIITKILFIMKCNGYS